MRSVQLDDKLQKGPWLKFGRILERRCLMRADRTLFDQTSRDVITQENFASKRNVSAAVCGSDCLRWAFSFTRVA